MLETHVVVTCREVEHDRASLDIDLQGKLDRVEGVGGSSLCAAERKRPAPVRRMPPPCPSSEFTSRETARIDDRYTSRSCLTGALRETDSPT